MLLSNNDVCVLKHMLVHGASLQHLYLELQHLQLVTSGREVGRVGRLVNPRVQAVLLRPKPGHALLVRLAEGASCAIGTHDPRAYL